MIVTVTLNPSVDRTLIVERLQFGDTNRVLRTETDAGGKGINLSRVAKELGSQVIALGLLGGGSGAYVRNVLDKEGVAHDFVEVEGDTRINISIELDDGSMPPTTLNEQGPEIDPEAWEKLQAKVRERAKGASFVSVGGSVPPGLKPEVFRDLAKVIEGAGSKVVLDTDGDPLKFGLDAKPFLAKPNSREAERLLIKPVRTKMQCIEAAKEIRAKGIPIVVVSRGAAGAVMACEEGVFEGLAPTVRARSTIGSGDSMLGAMAWCLESGKSMVEAFAWGIAAGAATATTTGAEICRRPMVESLLAEVKIERQRTSS